MGRHNLEKKFISRLEKTQRLFGYISLDAIINSHLNHHRNNNIMTLKKVHHINNMTILKRPITEQFIYMQQQQKLKEANMNNC
ncbi:hypothetical protein [Photobacterium andalusiense]|uniref:Uncharacterized protein n=1 Tax=Photobacterium andalusiense TaxID=2204296 RepID=A0A1Y6ME93_9GAMM|nr:hypothetical protein [Photobacterium andalusiense]SMY34249.1 hypothetical protein PAND9192_01235 [Photobacterium andalusiense]